MPWADRLGASVWPNGARMAFVGVLALEQWDWNHPQIVSVSGRPPFNPNPHLGRSPLDTRSQISYGAEYGCRRLNEMLVALGVKFSMLITGSFAEDYPDVVKEMAEGGHDLCGHAWSYSEFFTSLSYEQQRDTIIRTAEIIKTTTGRTMLGWIGQSASADDSTIAACMDLGLLYNADLQGDELPYFMEAGGKTLVEVPYRIIGSANDLLLVRTQTMSLKDTLDYMKDSFDRCWEEAGRRPSLFNLGIHPFVSGRPDSASLVREFLQHVQSRGDVWIASLDDVAKWWSQRYGDGYPT